MNAEGLLARHPDVVDEDGHLIRALHGITLQTIVESLHADYGWSALATRIPVQCFMNNPSVASSLTFLRRTPWARKQVETLYIAMRTAQVLGISRP